MPPNGWRVVWPKREPIYLGQTGKWNAQYVDLDAAASDYRRALDGVEAAKRAAQRRIDAAREYADAARETLHAAIVEAAEDGIRPIEIQRRTGYTAERVRQILRAAGVEPD